MSATSINSTPNRRQHAKHRAFTTLAASSTLNLTGIANAAGNEILCYDTSGGPVTYESAVSGCIPSDETMKNLGMRVNPFVAMWRVAWYVGPAYYTFKDTARFGKQTHIGLYAQEVCRMEMTLCSWDRTGTLNYDKVGLAAYVIAAVKGAAYSIGILIALIFGGLFAHTRRSHNRLHQRLQVLETR